MKYALLASLTVLSLVEGASHANPIDRAVFSRLEAIGVQRAAMTSDAVFLRRVYLDAIGTLPTAVEARAFIEDPDPAKRTKLIDRLLQREEFAQYWSMKWGETLRIKSEFPINLWPNAAQAYHRWIYTNVRDNVPYDRFARELLTASGSNFRVPPVNFYRAIQSREPESVAAAVALTFMGSRIDTWPADRRQALAAFFSRIGYKPTREWKEEIVYFDVLRTAATTAFTLPDGTRVHVAPDGDPRDAFAAWLTTPANPWFAKAIVNRVWFWLLGRGIIHEPDDIRPDNPPVNPELLALLERELVRTRFDLRHLYRQILNSMTYQLSATTPMPGGIAQTNFAHYSVRPLEAEALIDALCAITGTSEAYASAIPEPFTFMPRDQRAITLPDGSITSAFLETFGRPSRDTGLAEERSTRVTAAARLHLLNSSHLQRKLEESPALRAIVQQRRGPRAIVTELYLTILSRFPTDDEVTAIENYARSSGANPRTATIDVAWALMNSAEFLHRH